MGGGKVRDGEVLRCLVRLQGGLGSILARITRSHLGKVPPVVAVHFEIEHLQLPRAFSAMRRSRAMQATGSGDLGLCIDGSRDQVLVQDIDDLAANARELLFNLRPPRD